MDENLLKLMDQFIEENHDDVQKRIQIEKLQIQKENQFLKESNKNFIKNLDRL